jgi:hypothetical protein
MRNCLFSRVGGLMGAEYIPRLATEILVCCQNPVALETCILYFDNFVLYYFPYLRVVIPSLLHHEFPPSSVATKQSQSSTRSGERWCIGKYLTISKRSTTIISACNYDARASSYEPTQHLQTHGRHPQHERICTTDARPKGRVSQ